MKKLFVLTGIVILLITNILLIRTITLYKAEVNSQVFKVYSFEGENTNIRISNGLVIISPSKEIVSGGKIQYIGNELENIKSYAKSIYLNKQGDKDIVLSNTVLLDGDNHVTAFPDEFLLNTDIGEISSESLFSKDDLNLLKDNLYFNLDYLTVDGQMGNFTVKLNLKEFNMD